MPDLYNIFGLNSFPSCLLPDGLHISTYLISNSFSRKKKKKKRKTSKSKNTKPKPGYGLHPGVWLIYPVTLLSTLNC
ncbi:hypothetical protein I79_022141 [Cricetulus griseus]|uniref:Uncharacterized protein n=1 Tax=Cricetulus griseus TaxID=10029 RepID=G3IEJ4_CRIGR|nr:hypothetical protein I79_022141 [Cricetulus griseus]